MNAQAVALVNDAGNRPVYVMVTDPRVDPANRCVVWHTTFARPFTYDGDGSVTRGVCWTPLGGVAEDALHNAMALVSDGWL